MKCEKVQQVLEHIERASRPTRPRSGLAFRYNHGNYLDEMTMEFCSCTKLNEPEQQPLEGREVGMFSAPSSLIPRWPFYTKVEEIFRKGFWDTMWLNLWALEIS